MMMIIILIITFYTHGSIDPSRGLKTRVKSKAGWSGTSPIRSGGNQKRAFEGHRIVSLDRQGDPQEKVHFSGSFMEAQTATNNWL